jgi:diacylglycerol O-acyltransferase
MWSHRTSLVRRRRSTWRVGGVLELIPYVPTAQQIRASAAMVSYAGGLTVGITADAETLPDADRLIAAVGQEFSDLVAERGRSRA